MFVYEDFLENHKFFRSEYIRLGKLIRYRRSKMGLSQKELASLVGIDPSNLCKIERGLTGYNVATLLLILRRLGLKLVFHESYS